MICVAFIIVTLDCFKIYLNDVSKIDFLIIKPQ